MYTKMFPFLLNSVSISIYSFAFLVRIGRQNERNECLEKGVKDEYSKQLIDAFLTISSCSIASCSFPPNRKKAQICREM